MLYLTVAGIALMVVTTIAICAGLALLWHDEIVRARGRRRASEAAGEPVAEPPAAVRAVRPESLEGVLAGQLLAGEISRSQYQRAMEGLAARDESRHPQVVPPEFGTSGV